MSHARFTFSPDLAAAQVAAALAAALRSADEGPRDLLRQWLDTFDWRLWQHGARLIRERDRSVTVLRWRPADDQPVIVLPEQRTVLRTGDLPDTLAGRAIAALAGPRALLPRAACRVEQRRITVRDPRGKTVARVDVERCTDLGSDGTTAEGRQRTAVAVTGMAGYTRELKAVLGTLGNDPNLTPASDDELVLAARAAGQTPGGYRSRPRLQIRPDEPAETAVRRYLTALLDIVEANLPGVREDLDIEFLHDLRVAVRRSRAAVGQLEGLVPAELAERWAPELRWIGGVTGPCRDLDVYLESLGGITAEAGLGDPDSLAAFVALLEHERSEAHRELVAALDGDRFRRFADGWRCRLGERFEDPDQPARAIAELARRRVRRALRRVLGRGAELGCASPPASFHRLRIDAKKLRYLLELFAGVLDRDRSELAIKELKGLQDLLGGLQDVAVQRERLHRAAERLVAVDAGGARTVLAMGRLAGVLDSRERSLREAFHDRFDRFSGSQGQAAFAILLRRGGAS